MDLYDSLDKMKQQDIDDELQRYQDASLKFAEQGFAESEVVELLVVEGCSKDNAKILATAAENDLPIDYHKSTPPASFRDVEKHVEKTILEASVKDIDEYLKKNHGKKYAEIINRILMARDQKSEYLVNQVVEEIKPIVEEMIMTNRALATQEKSAGLVDNREKIEQELFGVWPVYLIQKRAEIDKADEKLLKKSKIQPGDNISFI